MVFFCTNVKQYCFSGPMFLLLYIIRGNFDQYFTRLYIYYVKQYCFSCAMFLLLYFIKGNFDQCFTRVYIYFSDPVPAKHATKWWMLCLLLLVLIPILLGALIFYRKHKTRGYRPIYTPPREMDSYL